MLSLVHTQSLIIRGVFVTSPQNHALVATCSPAPQDPARAMMPLCLRPTPVRGYQDTSHGGGTCRTETESTDAAIHLGLFSWDTEG
jgi:hypothetical protein